MSYLNSAPLSPITSNDDDQEWINELITKSAPMTTTNSFTGIVNLANISNFDMTPAVKEANFKKYFDNDSVFSNEFAGSTEISEANTPEIKRELVMMFPDLRSVNVKLENFQNDNDKTPELTPNSLESFFDTKDVLKAQSQSQETLPSNMSVNLTTQSTNVGDKKLKTTKRRCPRKRLTETQKEAHNKIEKKYRNNINTKIAGLQQIIPWVSSVGCQENSSNRLYKSLILERATEYILHLQKNQAKIEQENLELKREVARLCGREAY